MIAEEIETLIAHRTHINELVETFDSEDEIREFIKQGIERTDQNIGHICDLIKAEFAELVNTANTFDIIDIDEVVEKIKNNEE